MSNRERKVRGKRLMALLFALMLALGSVTPSSAVSKGNAGKRISEANSTLYDLAGINYQGANSLSEGDPVTVPDPVPDPAPVYVPDPV